MAEGIETQAQCDLLRSLGCSLGQGYRFAHPLEAVDVGAYLRLPDIAADARPSLVN